MKHSIQIPKTQKVGKIFDLTDFIEMNKNLAGKAR
jgi:hypothetical protein